MNMPHGIKIVLALFLFTLVSSASALVIRTNTDNIQSKEGSLELGLGIPALDGAIFYYFV